MTREQWFKGVLAKYERIAICGGPRAGKSTLSMLALGTGKHVIHSDDYMALDWSEASAELARVANNTRGGLVVEGVAVPRALRKGLRVDCVVWLDEPLEPLTKGQQSMRKGCMTVFADYYRDNKNVPVLQAPKAST